MKFYLNEDLNVNDYSDVLNYYLKRSKEPKDYIKMPSLTTKKQIDKFVKHLNGEKQVSFYNFKSLNLTLGEFRFLYSCLEEEGVGLVFLKENSEFLDVAIGIMNIETEVVSARVRRGIVTARKKGKSLGRPKIDDEVADRISFLYNSQKKNFREIAKECDVSLGTVHKYIHKTK